MSLAVVITSPRTCSGLACAGVMHAVLDVRDGERLRRMARVEQLGDAEVEQLRRAVGGDQDVVRLQVAMHDQVLMRVVHRARRLCARAASRSSSGSRRRSQYASIGSPSMYSMTR